MTTLKFPPTPSEDPMNGKNDNVYEAGGNADYADKLAFIGSIVKDVVLIASSSGLPPSAILAQCCLESGFGFTRTAVFGNNLLGLKCWGNKWKSAYANGTFQLIDQPNEGEAHVIKTLPSGQVLFDEDKRPDNWYWSFANRVDSVKTFVREWICGGNFTKKYTSMPLLYQKNRKSMGKPAAAKQFLFDIAELGYCGRGGDFYRKECGAIIDQFHLDLLD